MIRSEIASELANRHPNILRKDIEKIIDIILFEIFEALNSEKFSGVQLRGFGNFSTKIQKAKIGRNPKNSNIIQIPEKKAIKWKMSKTFFNRLNKNFTENKISDTY